MGRKIVRVSYIYSGKCLLYCTLDEVIYEEWEDGNIYLLDRKNPYGAWFYLNGDWRTQWEECL